MINFCFMKYILVLLFFQGYSFQKQSIPEHLLQCYKDGVVLLPMTMTVFIEIIRKLETSPYFLMDMKSFSTILFHRFSRDGIEKDREFVILVDGVIPYTTTGFQSFKYQLLSYYLIPKSFKNFPNNILNLEEQCTLHFMLSSSVDIWERGDENKVCPESFRNQNASSFTNWRRKSSCPFERGVVKTNGYGNVSPNHIISAIATALQPMNIDPRQMLKKIVNNDMIGDMIDNRWVTTFSGDLAEILIIQKPITEENYNFGPGGKWDDEKLPTKYYLKMNNKAVENELWQFTNAEINGATDGMQLGEEATKWAQSMRVLRLSQLLESYYTNKFGFHMSKSHACKRHLYFDKVIQKSSTLIEQVQSFSFLMANYMPNYLIEKSIINRESEALVKQFLNYGSIILRNSESCSQEIHTNMKIKLNIIYDNTWPHHDTLTFLMNLAERVDVSYYGSEMTVIAGDMGNIVAESCKSIGDLYYNWRMYVHDQGKMHLSNSLIYMNNLSNGTSSNENNIKWYSHVTVILGMSTILNDEEIEDTMAILTSIKKQNPDMLFFFITSVPLAPMYVKLTSILDSQDDRIISVQGNNCHQILDELEALNFYPVAITPLPCMNKNKKKIIETKDYARPGLVNFYRIHPQYLCQVSGSVVIMFQNKNHGNLLVCISRDTTGSSEECQGMSLNEGILFKIKNPCDSKIVYKDHQTWDENCQPIYISVSAKQSLSLCTEIECQTPDDVGFQISIEGLHCTSLNGNSCNTGNILKGKSTDNDSQRVPIKQDESSGRLTNVNSNKIVLYEFIDVMLILSLILHVFNYNL